MPAINYTYQGVTYYNFYVHEAWQGITYVDSPEYRLKADAGMNFDSEGFGIINGRYVIACTSALDNGGMFGVVGDYVDWKLANGTILPTVIGDIKSRNDPNWIPIGHTEGGGVSVVEFLVDGNTWIGHANPGTSSCHPEWAGQIQSWENVGNFWTSGNTTVVSGNLIIKAGKYVNGKLVTVTYAATQQGDGYIYFNDDQFFRCFPDGSFLQIKQREKNLWVNTEVLFNISLSSTSFGAGAVAPSSPVEASVAEAVRVANSPMHGYSQRDRDGNPDFDCSSFVCHCFHVGGFSSIPDADSAPSTLGMVSIFTAAGFTWYPGMGNDASQLQRGDILLHERDHTCIYIGNNQVANAGWGEYDYAGGNPASYKFEPGDQTGKEIWVRDYYIYENRNDGIYGWDGILRYIGI